MNNKLTTTQAAHLIGYAPNSIASLCSAGAIKAEKGRYGRWIVDKASLLKYKAERDAAPVNKSFTAVTDSVRESELARNRRLMAERIAQANPRKAVYLRHSGEQVSRKEWFGSK